MRKKLYSATLKRTFSLPIVMKLYKAIRKKYNNNLDQFLLNKTD